jgi:hypothetical protein
MEQNKMQCLQLGYILKQKRPSANKLRTVLRAVKIMNNKDSTQWDPISFTLKVGSNVLNNWLADDWTRPK